MQPRPLENPRPSSWKAGSPPTRWRRSGALRSRRCRATRTSRIRVDAARLEYVDDTGIALLFDLRRRERPQGAEVQIENLAPNLAALVDGYDPEDFAETYRKPAADRHRRARRPGHRRT